MMKIAGHFENGGVAAVRLESGRKDRGVRKAPAVGEDCGRTRNREEKPVRPFLERDDGMAATVQWKSESFDGYQMLSQKLP